jgi:hypothetical protein
LRPLAVEVVSGKATTQYAATTCARHAGGSGWTSEQYASCVVGTISGTSNRIGLIARASSAVNPSENMYVVWYDDALNSFTFGAWKAGSFAAIGSTEAYVLSNGSTLKFYAETSGADALLTVFVDGTPITTRTDNSSPIAGASTDRVGVLAHTGGTMDTFIGGIITSGSTFGRIALQPFSLAGNGGGLAG